MKTSFFYICIPFLFSCLLQSQSDCICLTLVPSFITFFYFLVNPEAYYNSCLPFKACNSPKIKRIAEGFSRSILII